MSTGQQITVQLNITTAEDEQASKRTDIVAFIFSNLGGIFLSHREIIRAIEELSEETQAVLRDIITHKQADKKINYLAYHDYLTGLPNKLCFLDRLSLEIAHALRNKKMLAVMYLDLNRFKAVNDSMGHDAGDQLLVDVAGRLRCVARQCDTVARIGGDEFGVLLTWLNQPRDAAVFAQRLVEAFTKPARLGTYDYEISPSIGITLYPGDGDSPDLLLQKADQAMYRAKKEGSICQYHNYYLNER